MEKISEARLLIDVSPEEFTVLTRGTGEWKGWDGYRDQYITTYPGRYIS